MSGGSRGTKLYTRTLSVQSLMITLYTCTVVYFTTCLQCPTNLDLITVSLMDDTLVFSITGELVCSDFTYTHWAVVSRDEVTENIKGVSDMVYAVTSLAIGEVLLREEIDKGEVHIYPR